MIYHTPAEERRRAEGIHRSSQDRRALKQASIPGDFYGWPRGIFMKCRWILWYINTIYIYIYIHIFSYIYIYIHTHTRYWARLNICPCVHSGRAMSCNITAAQSCCSSLVSRIFFPMMRYWQHRRRLLGIYWIWPWSGPGCDGYKFQFRGSKGREMILHCGQHFEKGNVDRGNKWK